jgi:hypothetical protein
MAPHIFFSPYLPFAGSTYSKGEKTVLIKMVMKVEGLGQ